MLKPVPGITEEEAIEDIHLGINYLSELSCKHGINVNMHLNPTYVSYGTELETEFRKGNYQPPYLESARKAVLGAKDKNISIYVGLNDEGLAVPGGSFLREEEKGFS